MSLILNAYLSVISLLALGMLLLGTRSYKQQIFTSKHKPKTLVIVPCRGRDVTLEENLKAIGRQKYPNYDLVCVVDEESDEALVTIKKLRLHYIISSARCEDCSGKVRAIATALEKYRNYSAYVIADSDTLPDSGWLSNLLLPLSESKIGLSTSYPFFNPIGGFWSKVKSAWGLVGEGMMESEVTVFGWGGSLAFRKSLLDKKSLNFFKESVADDIALTKIARKKSLRIFYAKNAMTQVNVREGLGDFIEWANRQTAASIYGDPRVFYFGISFYFAQILLLLSGLIFGIFYNPIFLLLFVPLILGTLRGYRRLRNKYPEFFAISVALPFLYFANLILARHLSVISWRGRRYKLK